MKAWRKVVILLMLMVFIAGLGFLLYPYLQGAIADYRITQEAHEFLEKVDNWPTKPEETIPIVTEPPVTEPEETEPVLYPELLAAMESYNQQIWEEKQSGLCDPWAYEQPSFKLGDYGLEDEVFGVISIPRLELEMPIYLGATYKHMADGAAHLSQTSLPIGGENTNCVIAGHRGWGGASYFRYITELETGDEIIITNLWGELRYTVVDTKIIDPNDVKEILIQQDRELLTLLTCHPYASGGKYRYVVYCERNNVDELLQEFPESKDSYEYQDLLRQPNKGNASEFITRTIEENLDQVDKRENYVQYIAKRPRVEKIGTHGLFTDDNVPVHLNEVAEEVATHQGVLMTQILSLRREDAARLGYEKGEAWRTLIRNHTKDMSEAMNIPMEDLRWYAAFHNESHHPHCHIIAYSIGKEPYITQERLLKLKSAFGSEMFRNERMQAFQEQTKYRDQLAEETRQLVSRIVDEINTGVYQNETVALMLQSLSEYVQRAKGKKQYGYLPQSARNLVNGIIDELAKDPRIESLYELWYKQSVEIASIYQDNPPVKPPLSENKSFHKVRNIVVQEAMNLLLEPQELEPFVEKADEVVEQEMPVPQIVEPETVMIPTEVIEVPEEDPNSEEPEFKPPTILKPFFYRGNDGNWWSQNYKDARRFLYGTKETPPDFENARKLLAEEAEQGNGLAMYDLGKMYLDGLDCDADEIVAQEWFGKALNAFHKRERTDQRKDYWQYRIGKMHSLGHGTDQDYEVSAQWFAKATQEDNPYSQYALGGQYQRGQGVEQSYEQAVALYTQAAENTSRPNAYAQYQLGNLYKEGLGVAVDPKQSAKWYAMAYQSFLKMEQSMADDKLYYRLGSMNLNGIGTVQNLAIAKDYLEKAAALGNVDAKYGLGKLHLLEDPEIYDPTKAMAYLEEAAENDHSYAQYKLGKLLIEGTIVSADLSKGIRWLESSAEQDNPYAQYYLGKLYLYGDVVEADPDRALVLLSRAIRQGNLPAEYLLGKALWEGKHISANQNRALELLTDAAERNYDPAMYALAKIYLAGYVSDADIAKALELLEKAAEADNQFAQYQLGKMLLFGQHVEQDEEAGKEWLRRSAAQGNIYAQRLLDNYGRAPLGLMAFRLLGHLARIIQDDIEQKQETNRQLIDRKLLSKIAEKKQAQGQKMG